MRLIILFFTLLVPSWAMANICVPEPTEKLKVVGVEDDDTLNVREGYTTNYKVITELLPRQGSIKFKDVVYKSEDCSLLCDDFIYLIENDKNNEAIETQKQIIQESCKNNSKIWYLISMPDGKEGWASAKYLVGYTDLKPSERAPKNEETVSNEIIEHVVVKGDTAYAISKKYNISLDDLAKRNNLDASFSLGLGQKLVISNNTTQAKKTEELSKTQSKDTSETSKEVVRNNQASSIELEKPSDSEPASVAKSDNSKVESELPSVCKTQSVDCFVLNLGKSEYAFHWKGNRIYYKKKNVSSLKINGRVVSSSDSPTKSSPLKWSINNRVVKLSSEIINLSIDYKKNRLLIVNGKALGNLDYAFQKMENAFEAEKSKIKQREKQERQDNFLKVSFSKLSVQQKEQVQSLLSKLGFYNSLVDGMWGTSTLQAVREFTKNYNLGTKLPSANDVSSATEIYSKILSYQADEAAYLEAVKKKEEENRIKAELDAAKERERKKREAQEQKLFCENAQNSDFWKRFSFLREKPINILGIDMSMSAGEIRKVLECKNYSCQYETNMWGAKLLVCSAKKAQITISSTNLSFNCASLNVCGLTLEEVGQELINAGKIFAMEPSVDFNSELNLQTTKYCGRGRAGDTLCVNQISFVTLNSIENALLGGGEIITILNKGNLGKAKPNFD